MCIYINRESEADIAEEQEKSASYEAAVREIKEVLYIYTYMYIHTYIYIMREKERERGAGENCLL